MHVVLLGRGIFGGAHDHVRLGDHGGRFDEILREAEIAHFDLALAGEHDVRGFDVAMYDAL
jgi:hypothetical protein